MRYARNYPEIDVNSFSNESIGAEDEKKKLRDEINGKISTMDGEFIDLTDSDIDEMQECIESSDDDNGKFITYNIVILIITIHSFCR